jgi:hypothetical protein
VDWTRSRGGIPAGAAGAWKSWRCDERGATAASVLGRQRLGGTRAWHQKAGSLFLLCSTSLPCSAVPFPGAREFDRGRGGTCLRGSALIRRRSSPFPVIVLRAVDCWQEGPGFTGCCAAAACAVRTCECVRACTCTWIGGCACVRAWRGGDSTQLNGRFVFRFSRISYTNNFVRMWHLRFGRRYMSAHRPRHAISCFSRPTIRRCSRRRHITQKG